MVKTAERSVETSADAPYREHLWKIADGRWPTQIILSRSVDHAAIVIEYLFRKANRRVEILTGKLNETVYGTSGVIDAATEFLRAQQWTDIRILSEQEIDDDAHPFFRAMKQAGLRARVDWRIVPRHLQETYTFHFTVADRQSFRFEESRDKFEAIVQFGEESIGAKLHETFAALFAASPLARTH